MLRSVGVTVLCALLAFLVVGIAPRDLGATTDPAAQRALDAVTTETFDATAPIALFPKDFGSVMGYWPIVVTGPKGNQILIKANGDCSAFSGDTKYTFGVVCKEHDLAYDILRYSAAVDRPLPAASRMQADDMFRRELHNNCDYARWSGADLAICHFWAESFALAVEFNSWRQGYQPPALVESVLRWELCVLFFLVLWWLRRVHERLEADPFELRLTSGRR